MISRLFACAAAALLLVSASGAETQARVLKADYGVSVRGIPVGRAELRAHIDERRYTVSFSGSVTGVVRLFFDASAHGEATGTLGDDRPRAATYAHTWVEDDDTESVTMRFAGDGVTEISVTPPRSADGRIVPLSEADKADAIDMVSAFLWPTATDAAPETCTRTLPLIDGKRRFNVHAAYARTAWFEPRRGNRKYRAFVCSLSYEPVSGHRADKDDDGLLAGTHDLEVWLVRTGGGVAVPVRVQIGSRFGRVVIEATRLDEE